MTKGLVIAAAGLWGAMAVLDALWLGMATKLFYRPRLGSLLNDTPVWPAAIAFYLLYGLGVLVFVLRPALQGDDPLPQAMLYGAFFGLVAYGAYDLTNLATTRGWPLSVTVVDMAWGAAMTAATVGFALWLARRFG